MRHFISQLAVSSMPCVILLAAMLAGSARRTAAEPIPKKDIIDIHCHTAGIGAGGSGCFLSPAMRRSWKYGIYLKSFGVSEEELLREGDGLITRRLSETLAQSRRVRAAVVLAMDAVIDANGEMDKARTEIYIPNEFVARETGRYPNLLFGASINPYRPDAMSRLTKLVADGAVLMKWLPSIQHIDPADERLIPFYRRLKELGLPLLIHTGTEHSFTGALNELADPERLRLPLGLGVTVIAAHAGGSGRYQGEKSQERFLRLATEYPNLHADLSALTQLNRIGHLPWLVRHPELHDRLWYGSDMPLLNTAIISAWGFIFRLPFAKIITINRIANPWDRDVALKEALGATPGILKTSARLMNRDTKKRMGW